MCVVKIRRALHSNGLHSRSPRKNRSYRQLITKDALIVGGVDNLVFIKNAMTKMAYSNIFKNNLVTSVEKLGLQGSWTFQEDNDLKHTAKVVQECLLFQTPKMPDHAFQSPDLNPIDHLWKHLDRQVQKRTISNKNMLKFVLMEEWQKISPNVTK